MKFLSLLVILFSFYLSSQAQDTVLVLNKKFNKYGLFEAKYKALTSVDSVSGNLFLTLADNKTIERYKIDSNWVVKDHFSAQRGIYADLPFDRFASMKLINNRDKEYAVYNLKDKIITINEVDYQQKKELLLSEFTIGRHESLVTYFTYGNTICLITANKKNNKVSIINNVKLGGISFDTVVVELKTDIINNTASKVMSYSKYVEPYEDGRVELQLGAKIYFADNILYFVKDHEDSTFVNEVNLYTSITKEKIFKQIIENKKSKKIYLNEVSSCLFDQWIINVNSINKTLSVSIYNYASGALIRNFKVTEENLADFMGLTDHSKSSKDSVNLSKNDSVSHFFRKLKKKAITISVEGVDNE